MTDMNANTNLNMDGGIKMSENYFVKLFAVNVSGKIEKKNGLSYVSWPYAWAEVKKLFPDATYTVYENANGWNYHTDGRTCWVKTGLTVNGIEHVEMLPIMDFKNRSIPLDSVTSMDVNKAIQRSLTKAAARHGLGLYVYAGEDLPEVENEKLLEKAQNDIPEEAVTADKVIDLPKHDAWRPRTAAAVWCQTHELSLEDFAEIRKMLIKDGKAEDVPVKDLTREQAGALFAAVSDYRKQQSA